MDIKRRFNSLAKFGLAVTLIVTLLVPATANAFTAYGSGTSGNPYRIATCAQLQEIDNNLSGYYTLVSNVDCTGITFTPIGSATPFSGTLDGLNHTISNLIINNAGGLFANTLGATIKNISIDSGTISGTGNTGSFVGFSRHSTLDNVHSSMTVATFTNSAYVGGLVGGSMEATVISRSSYSGTISGGVYIGGLVGYQGSLTPTADVLSDSYFDGTLNVGNGSAFIGGVMGILYSGTVRNTYSSGTINMTGTITYAGGLIGISYKGATNNSFSASLIHGTGTNVGATFGLFYGAAHTFSSTRSNNYFDQYRSNDNNTNSLSCASLDDGSGDCTAVNTSNASPNYFKNNQSSAPFSTWDFGTIWQTTSGYPTLRSLANFATQLTPNNGDANGDGVQDSYQANIASVQGSNSVWSTVTVPQASGCTIDSLASNSATTADKSYAPQVNLNNFSIYCPSAGSTVTVTLIYDKQYNTNSSVLRFYNPTTKAYSTISGATFGTKTIGGVVKTTATYNITDGGTYDEDGTANGIIIDPVGFAAAVAAPNTGFGSRQDGSSQLLPVELVVVSAGLFGISVILRKLQQK
jgi:hypothetical protein